MSISMPPEWAPQAWLWIGFPHDASLWVDELVPAQEQIAAFANAVAETGQQVRLVVRDAANEARARELVSGAVMCERHAYGDIWLRDSGPLVIFDESGRRTEEIVQGPPGDYLALYRGVRDVWSDFSPSIPEYMRPVPLDRAVEVMEVIEAGLVSARERREVILED